jgi:penicillin-binding protein 1A
MPWKKIGYQFFLALLAVSLALTLVTGMGVAGALWYYGRDLPDYQQLADYQPPTTTRVHAADGRLIAEFARERRLFVPISAMPKLVIDAFLSAEDKNFYSHSGLDMVGVLRAVVQNIANVVLRRRLVGASTITQQVTKNFLLSNEVTAERKIKEIVLALRIERTFSKDRILELYLNQIYLGGGAYGVASAALQYFDKSLDELEPAEAAFIAALPKAPNNYHPVRYADRARARRDWVIERMAEDGALSPEAAAMAAASPLNVRMREDYQLTRSEWFAEEVRRQLYQRFGENGVYESGLSVRTSMSSRLQDFGERALRQGLIDYTKRHSGDSARKLGHISPNGEWAKSLAELPRPAGLMDTWVSAVVLEAKGGEFKLGFSDGSQGRMPLSETPWADGKTAFNRLRAGDVVAVEAVAKAKGNFAFRQTPDVNGALVAMDPHTGRVQALVGGWAFGHDQFNRATQALRQPGSAFKPFVYAAALDSGFTPSSLVLDAPFVIDQGAGLGKWRPTNYTDDFLGPATLRVGLEQSRNLMTVRLAQAVGMDVVADYAKRLGVVDHLAPFLAMSLGAGETTLLRLTTGYAQFVNGGKRIEPTLIDRVQDRTGKTVYRQDQRPCPDCVAAVWGGQPPPILPDTRETVLDEGTAYQVVALLQGVVERGTGYSIRQLNRPLAGKTGTTNDSADAWFVGFSPDLAVGVYVGFDTPRTLGEKETGSSVAAPIFKRFMADALGDTPAQPFRVPPGLTFVRVNPKTGLPAAADDAQAIFEPFKPGTEPTADAWTERPVLGGSSFEIGPEWIDPDQSPPGTGGLY